MRIYGVPARIRFAALPRTPFGELQQYFEEPIPASELDEERASALRYFNVPSPAELAKAVAHYSRETERSAKAELAMQIALRHASALAVPETLIWMERAISAFPEDRREAQIDAARQVASELRPVYGDELRRWIAGCVSAPTDRWSSIPGKWRSARASRPRLP